MPTPPAAIPETFLLPAGFKIVSGGQTGADQVALDWAIAHAVAHGGWCPRNRRSDDGPIDARYALTETPLADYRQRNEWNVRDSDATVIFTLEEKLDGGSKLTATFAESLQRPWLHMRPRVDPRHLARFLARIDVQTLNVAGKRESSTPGISAYVKETLDRCLRTS